MTLQDLVEYLKGQAGAGISANQLQKMAEVAAEAGYAGVWGAYPWSVRRGTGTLTTTASTAHTVLPVDFESVTSIRYAGSSRAHVVDILEEVAFDTSFPNPSLVTGLPTHCKIVYETPQGNNKWRVVWYPVPDSAYSYTLTYNRKSDLANLPNLPSWMLHAVVQRCAVLMEPTVEGQYQRKILADQALSDAIAADRPVTGIGPQFGADPGWDDFHLSTGRGYSTWP